MAFLGESLFGPRATADELLAAMDEAGIDRAVVAPMRPRGYDLRPANDLVAEACRSRDGRLAGLARVDPNLGEQAAVEAERGLTELGLAGLFLHPWEETFRVSGPATASLMDVARAHRAPVVVAAGYPWLSEGLQVGELARRHPEVRVVATNGGQINISGLGQTDVELALGASPNLLLQTAGVYREDFLENVVTRFGAGRLMFSSHFPLFDVRLEIRRCQWMHSSDEARAAVLGGSAADIFGL